MENLKLVCRAVCMMQRVVSVGISAVLSMTVFVLAAMLLLTVLESPYDLLAAAIILSGFGAVIVWKMRDELSGNNER